MKNPQDAIIDLFVYSDQRNWEGVSQIFSKNVKLDYSSMTGNPVSTLPAEEIVKAWKGVLPGFEHTHHQLGNFQIYQAGDTAKVNCYGTATHYLPDQGGNVWTVVGTYEFDLCKSHAGLWTINSMTFHFKYQDGNTNLPGKAIEHVKSKN